MWQQLLYKALILGATAILLPAQTFTTLTNFAGSTGYSPGYGSLVQGTDGNFYGTTEHGGAGGAGTVFQVTPAGALTVLYNFCSQAGCTDGSTPYAGLIPGTDGSFYGTTQNGGVGNMANVDGYGTVFRITSTGTLTTLYSFCAQANCVDGGAPTGGVIQAKDGNLYGITTNGGTASAGTVFKLTVAGTLTTLYSFCSQANCADGQQPFGGLLQAADGNLYGTTSAGGYVAPDTAGGTVFQISTTGKLTTLHTFYGGNEGFYSYSPLIQGSDGFLYGTANQGGSYGNGSVFKINTTGISFATVYSFRGPEGTNPYAGVIQGKDGNLYGTTATGASGYGSVFRLTTAGAETTLHAFCSLAACADGSNPFGGVIQAIDGNLYGTTLSGGTAALGTAFMLSPTATTAPGVTIKTNGVVPLYSSVPVVQTGEWVSIYGTGLASAPATWTGNFPASLGGTSVTIDGKATFLSYVSPTQINLQVPDDSTIGSVPVVVTTSSGDATSTVTLAQFGPSFSLLDTTHVAAIILRSDGSGAYGGGTYDIVGPTGNSLGYKTVAARAGDIVSLYAVGLGPTSPTVPAGKAYSGSAPTTFPVSLSINKQTVIPTFAGISSAGSYQINLVIPAGLGAGDVPLVATVNGIQTPSNVVISVQ